MPSEKETQFEKLWEGETPSGKNETKALQFRQKMSMALVQKGAPFNKDNAKLYWMGKLHVQREAMGSDDREFRGRKDEERQDRRGR